ncbi:MAG: hypothetical protein LBU28_11010 [Spirochaetaceae bacterium]|nr:hypothetical protein [Spirochaetaceae bacterium]
MVADEVRKLAESSSEQAKTVSAVLRVHDISRTNKENIVALLTEIGRFTL